MSASSLHSSRRRRFLGSALLVFGSVIVFLLILEGVLALVLPRYQSIYLSAPNTVQEFSCPPEECKGIIGPGKYIVNSQGVRADELTPDHTYRVLAVGGSTTESWFLDQLEMWPHGLQELLQAAWPKEKVWVGNAGKSGQTTLQHILHVRHLPDQFPDLDAVLVLTGLNDMSKRLRREGSFVPFTGPVDESGDLLETAFNVIPRSYKTDLPFYKRTNTWWFLTKLSYVLYHREENPFNFGYELSRQRLARQHGTPFPEHTLDMTSALEQYRHLLNLLVDEAEKKHLRLILMTQPALWGGNLTPEEDANLVYGQIQNGEEQLGFVSTKWLAKTLDQYNRITLDICAKRKVECLDLAKQLPMTTQIFYDDVHYSERGAQVVADIIAKYLEKTTPKK